MKHYYLLLWVLLIPALLLGQENSSKSKPESYRKARKRHATMQINGLYDGGVLLVRLKTKQTTIDALRERGKSEKAAQIEEEQRRYNQALIAAFKAKFDFCPVYFFYSHYTQQVKLGNWDSVAFVNEALQADASIKFEDPYYLVAEITSVVGDTAKYFDHYYYEPTANGPERKASYYGGNNLGFEALVMKSDQFIQLTRPFPYYERLLQKSLPTIVGGLNESLHRFHTKTLKKERRKAYRNNRS
ncbi:MAG: hypothetical protein AAF927_24920 [Bacteroidota bacterium]